MLEVRSGKLEAESCGTEDGRRVSGVGRLKTGDRRGCWITIKSKCNVTQSASEGSVDVRTGSQKTGDG